MSFESTITVAGTNVTLTRVEHPAGVPAFVDFQVSDTNNVSIGRVWEYQSKWRAKPTPGDRFVEMPKMLDALEVLVRMRRATIDQAGLHLEDASEWEADGLWHHVEEPAPARGFLNGLIKNTCPAGPIDAFTTSLLEGRDDRQVFPWDGHTPFVLVVEWVEVWIGYDGEVKHPAGGPTDPHGTPLRHKMSTSPQSGPEPVRWERKMGSTPFVIAYKIEAC